VPFSSKAGCKFTSIAKSRVIGEIESPVADVETREHETTPPSIDGDSCAQSGQNEVTIEYLQRHRAFI
jgi:hypothetical protein